MHDFTPEQLAETIKKQLEKGLSLNEIKSQFDTVGGSAEDFEAALKLMQPIKPATVQKSFSWCLKSLFSFLFSPKKVAADWAQSNFSLIVLLLLLLINSFASTVLSSSAFDVMRSIVEALASGKSFETNTFSVFNVLSSGEYVIASLIVLIMFMITVVPAHIISRFFGAKGSFSQTTLVSASSQLAITLSVGLVAIISLFEPSYAIWTLGTLGVLFVFWALWAWIKGLEALWQISQNKITLTVLITITVFLGFQPVINDLIKPQSSFNSADDDYLVQMYMEQEKAGSTTNPPSNLVYDAELDLNGWGEVKVGASKELVESLIGKAESERTARSLLGDKTIGNYFSRGVAVVYDAESLKVIELIVFVNKNTFQAELTPFSNRIYGNIGADSKSKDIIKAFGNPVIGKDSSRFLSYPGVRFSFFQEQTLQQIKFFDAYKFTNRYKNANTKESGIDVTLDIKKQTIGGIYIGMTKLDVEKTLGTSSNSFRNFFTYESRKDTTIELDSSHSHVVGVNVGSINSDEEGPYKLEPLFKTKSGLEFYDSEKEFIATLGPAETTKEYSGYKDLVYGDVTLRFGENGFLYDVFLGNQN